MLRHPGFVERLRTWTEGLTVGELDEVSVRILEAAVISHGVGFIARGPHQTTRLLCTVRDAIHGGATLEREAEVTEVVPLRAALRSSPQVFISTHFLEFAASLAREGRSTGLDFLQVELDAHEAPTYRFVPGVATTSLAHQTAARLGVTTQELMALIEWHRAASPKSHGRPALVPQS